MNKEILKGIKESIKESHKNACLAIAEEKEIRKEYDVKIKEETKDIEDEWYREHVIESINKQMNYEIEKMYASYDNETTYYLIYKDGSYVSISDADLISGDKTPKFTGIVYAMYSGTGDSYDTETGELRWYINMDESQDDCYEKEDERKMNYENWIEMKYNTEFGKKLLDRMID